MVDDTGQLTSGITVRITQLPALQGLKLIRRVGMGGAHYARPTG